MRPRQPASALFPVLLVAACGGPPPPTPPPPPPVLAYTVPDTTPVVYLHGDTTLIDVDAGGQTLTMDVASSARLETAFEAGPAGGVDVTIEIHDYSARASNPLGAPRTASAEDVAGPLTFSLDRRGRVTLTGRPELAAAAAEFLSAEALASTLFPRLPAQPATAGITWTDTVAVETERPSGSITSTTVLTYTLAGDTLVGGERFLLVRLQGRDERLVEGSQSGLEIVQDLRGEADGHLLWDAARGLLVESVYRSDLRGSMDLAVTATPLSVRVRSTTTTRLRE